MNMKKIFSIAFLLCSFCALHAQTNDAILAAIEKTNATYTSLTSDFTHTKVLATRAKRTMSGKQYYSDSKVAMHYTQPEGDRFVINGNTLYLNRSGKVQVFDLAKVAMMRGLSNSIMFAVKGQVRKIAEENDADMKVLDNGTHYIVSMTAKTSSAKGYARTSITYRKSDCVLVKLELEEFSHVINSFSFDNIVRNKAIDDSVYVIPAK